MVRTEPWRPNGIAVVAGRFKRQAGQPWMGQDSLVTYGNMWVFKEAAERAKSADREMVAAAIRPKH